ncbi:hypothetical protein F4810DRAFT_707969 [Camillea tinctor]|nr:hypothetical protein F4810DRAFT_707969 [Camillea tinctor]
MELSGDISDTDNEFGSISRIQRIQLRRSQIQRDKIRRLLFDSSSEDESESESPGGSTNPEPIVQFPNVTPSDEKSVLENSGSCNMVLISIDGLDGKDPFLACNGLELPGPVRRFSFKPGRIVGADATDEGIRGVATELLELGMESINIMHSQEPVDTALVFIASDLGGSVLKQALVEASQNPKYSQVLQSTALLIFFGTPHRSHPSCQWNHMLLELLYKQSTSLLGSWIPAQIQRLSAFHEVLATNFSTFLRSNTLDILSFYQEELEPNIYDILIPKNAAILDDPREIAIGLHRPHAHLGKFYTPEDQRFLISKLSDAKISTSPSILRV